MVKTTDNTIVAPPRLTGDPGQDARELQLWLTRLYQYLTLVLNVANLQTEIAALQAANAVLAQRITALGG